MTRTAASLMERARRMLKSCRLLMQEGDETSACNRAYYAMFYATHAALQAAGIIKPGVTYKTHAGLVAAFGKELVLTGKLPRDLGSSLSRVLRIRLVADYDSEAVEEVDAEWSISEAETFVAAIGEALPQLGAP